ncbi:hypothetical protein ABET51_08095 [Metabacillus fastidiosus]|uniref:hypothetical protein n=1 Tax=Metabacillus fastidiosus TaxID=1458 RepID=UPI002E211B78|nr:hypothetical protein [Metabacillus fastidiosus]
MENMFNNLKKAMDETILKDIEFSEQSKEKVRKTVINSKHKKQFHLKYKLNYLLSVCVSCLLLFGLGYFSFTKLELLGEDKNTTITDNPGQNLNTSQNSEKFDSIYTPPANKEYYGDMTKEEVVSKMLNTPSHFITATGKFEQRDIFKDETGLTILGEYKISTKNKIGGYFKFTNTSYERNEVVQIEEIIHNNDQMWYINNIRNTYREQKYNPKEMKGTVTLQEALSVNINKLENEIYVKQKDWEMPPIVTAGLSLYPYHMAVKYLGDFNQWDIEKQNEELLGHNTIVLKGKLNDKIKMPEVDTFRFWVDKDTGILVKYENHDTNGKLTGYLHPEELKVNVPIDSKDFEPHLDGYKMEEMDTESPFKDPREAEIEVVEQADYYKDEVDAVLDLLRKDIPFLYEFTHPDIELYSASYEKYKTYNQAYLTYSYKKDKNEDGSGSRLLYVRAYHKDSIVHSWSDFDTKKGKQLEDFNINGIEWKGFELDNQNAHFIGKSNDYIYEVVSQNITPQETKSLIPSFKASN